MSSWERFALIFAPVLLLSYVPVAFAAPLIFNDDDHFFPVAPMSMFATIRPVTILDEERLESVLGPEQAQQLLSRFDVFRP